MATKHDNEQRSGGRPRKARNAHLPAGVYARTRGRGTRYYDGLGTPLGVELLDAVSDGRPFSMLPVGKRAILSEAAIITRSQPLRILCGVYFLIADGKIVYVGQSVNISARVDSHITSGKWFERVAVVLCDEVELNALEAAYIAEFNPPLNRVKPKPAKAFVVRKKRSMPAKPPERPEPRMRFDFLDKKSPPERPKRPEATTPLPRP